jgi:N-sulfoglucosamine sulfohydrolase
VPGFLPDLPGVRQEYREYLSSSRRCDDVVAAVLGAVEATDTLVVFLSDNGIAVPFAKANCYLQSSRTPLIVRWPGVARPGMAEDTAFVSALDLLPTFCTAAGVPEPSGVDGQSLLPLLRGESQDGRDAVHTVFHETAMKGRFEMRCRQDARFGYIWNAWSDGTTEYRAENMLGLSWPAMVEAGGDRIGFYLHRAPEELYDLRADPHSLTNLAADPAYGEDLAAARRELLAWLESTGDPLAGTYRAFLAGS